MDDATDDMLMQAYRDGDAAAFEQLYRRHRQRLFQYLVRKTGSREIGEELYQEAWLRLIRQHRQWQPRARFRTWLFTLAQGCLVDHYRRQGHLARHEVTADTLPDAPACPAGEPDAALAGHQAERRFRHCLEALPPVQRDVFLLREEGEFALADIAEITGAGREAVKSRLRYALQKLRDCLGREDGHAAA